MSVLTTTYFINELTIPNLNDVGHVGVSVTNNVALYTARYEREFLELFIGETMYHDFIGGLATVPIPPIWTALKDQLYDTTRMLSPVANYVYFHYMRSQFPIMGQTGDFIPTGQNGIVQYSTNRLVKVWNDMVDLADEIYDWIGESGDYTAYTDIPLFDFDYMNVVGI